MPTVPIYIRQEDFEKWSAIEKKAEWVHQRLAEDKPDLQAVIDNIDKKPVPSVEVEEMPDWGA